MKIQFTLLNNRTGQTKTPIVDDAPSPSNGWTQAYADRVGQEYAAERAREVLNAPSFPKDTWTFIHAQYLSC